MDKNCILRLDCLRLAQAHSQTPHSGVYNVVDEAEKYWQFVRGPVISDECTPAPKTDDIPF
jgi:hypothetical protein